MKYKKIVVTGGSGMTGQALKKYIPNATYLSSSDYDLTSETYVIKMYEKLKPDCVIHLSAVVGGILDNINRPYDYFTDNVLMNTLMVKYAQIYGVERFIGILSTCIYPDKLSDDLYPLKEEYLHIGPPTPTNFSYGYAKRVMGVHIDACNTQHSTKYQYLIPCNLYGVGDKTGKSAHFVGALIEKIKVAKANNEKTIKLFGTGKPLRQFMYVDDFCKIIHKCIEDEIYDSMNVAVPENLSIREMVDITLKAMDAEYLEVIFDSTKPDGQYRKDVSTKKFSKKFPNFNFIKLYDGIKLTISE